MIVDERTGLPVVGMVGGGQLARMTHQAAIALGQSLRIMAERPDDGAALVAADVELGAPTDLDALRRFARSCDVLTFDHEHVPGEHLRTLAAEGVTIHPGADALRHAQDKASMRRRLADDGIPVPAFVVAAAADLATAAAAFGAEHGRTLVVKTATGGYDGRGVWVVADPGDLPDLPGDQRVVIEAHVPIRRELAAVVARSPFGQATAWPVVQTVQRDGICVEVIAPAPDLPAGRAAAATALAFRVAATLGVVGVLAVELFEVDPTADAPDGLVVNELAMRPHNSAHWTIEGSLTSQFEQHLRAVLDYPLGATAPVAPCAVMGNVLGGSDPAGSGVGIDERVHHLAARFPDVKVHLYGKGFRPGRKLGHVTVIGDDLPALRRRARLAAAFLGGGAWADGYPLHPDGDRRAILRADAFPPRHAAPPTHLDPSREER
jgi:5-(carboxyamino)imidazole ribonucleotide synthase